MRKYFLTFMMLASGMMPLLAQPVITSQPANQIVLTGSNVTFNVMATGVGPFIYQWQLNGTNLPNTNIITTVAGSGGNIGDGGLATNASVREPEGVAVDQMGNILISASSRIRKVDTNGIISTLVGTNGSGYSGDGGPAANAQMDSTFFSVNGITVDCLGNFYFADTGNFRVRKVDTNGIISTVAGNGNGSVFGDGGPATNANLSEAGITVDHFGNLFIADANLRIRKVDTNGIITTVAGTNNTLITYGGDGGPAVLARLQVPIGVSVDGFGNIFIADTGNSAIRKVDTNGIITTVAGIGFGNFSGDGGAATNAKLNTPFRVISDAFGNLFIADTYNNRIREVNANGIISTIAGTNVLGFSGDGGLATKSELDEPCDLALDPNGNLLIADYGNNRIRKINLAGSPTLTLNGVTTNNIGDYQVVITSPSGSVTSSIASLSVPSILTQPKGLSEAVGDTANFSVSVTNNPPFTYQWFTSSGRDAMAIPYVSGGRVLSASILDPGEGYVSTPLVHFVGGSGSGASGVALDNNGMVLTILINNQGSGYASVPPTIQIDAPPITSTALPGQTNNTLVLPAITSINVTNYFVVATSQYGSLTSTIVSLTEFLPPQNFTAQLFPTGLQLQFTGTPYYPYILQSTTNLTPPINWTPFYTNIAAANGTWIYNVTSLANTPGLFYRTVGQ